MGKDLNYSEIHELAQKISKEFIHKGYGITGYMSVIMYSLIATCSYNSMDKEEAIQMVREVWDEYEEDGIIEKFKKQRLEDNV